MIVRICCYIINTYSQFVLAISVYLTTYQFDEKTLTMYGCWATGVNNTVMMTSSNKKTFSALLDFCGGIHRSLTAELFLDLLLNCNDLENAITTISTTFVFSMKWGQSPSIMWIQTRGPEKTVLQNALSSKNILCKLRQRFLKGPTYNMPSFIQVKTWCQ